MRTFPTKQFLILLFVISAHISCKQDQDLLQHKKYFDQELKLWTNSFYHFNLSNFKKGETIHFENGSPQDFNDYKKFLSTYQPIITFLPDSSKFIDPYSVQINLVKEEDHYEAYPDDGQAVLLCDPATKYWDRIYTGTPGQWIDETIWLSKTTFILAGISKSSTEKKEPIILLGDTEKQTLIEYINTNQNCFQNDHGYRSPKLKKMVIEGL
jgi:hypothetical protein